MLNCITGERVEDPVWIGSSFFIRLTGQFSGTREMEFLFSLPYEQQMKKLGIVPSVQFLHIFISPSCWRASHGHLLLEAALTIHFLSLGLLRLLQIVKVLKLVVCNEHLNLFLN